MLPRGRSRWHGRCSRGPNMASHPRIVIASPHVAESTVIADWLASEGFEPVRLFTLERTIEEIRERAFDALVVDRTFACLPGQQTIGGVRARNRTTPIVVLGEADASGEAQVISR